MDRSEEIAAAAWKVVDRMGLALDRRQVVALGLVDLITLVVEQALSDDEPDDECPECGDSGACNGGPCPLVDEPDEHRGGNAEDCPACGGTNPPWPFLCPGEPDDGCPAFEPLPGVLNWCGACGQSKGMHSGDEPEVVDYTALDGTVLRVTLHAERDDAESATCCNPVDGRCGRAAIGPRCVKVGGCCFSMNAVCPVHH